MTHVSGYNGGLKLAGQFAPSLNTWFLGSINHTCLNGTINIWYADFWGSVAVQRLSFLGSHAYHVHTEDQGNLAIGNRDLYCLSNRLILRYYQCQRLRSPLDYVH
jgi:hypothetical protein